jgi:hypothetical protein
VRVVDIEAGVAGNHLPICVGGRGAAPPEFCGGPTGYRLMLKRQRLGAALSDPVLVKTGIAMLAEACPEEPPQTWALHGTVLKKVFRASMTDCRNSVRWRRIGSACRRPIRD